MPEFLVTYEQERYFPGEKETIQKRAVQVLVIEAGDRVQAFVTAFDYLTRRGYLIPTVNRDMYKRLDQPVAGLTEEEMQAVYEAGVPKNYKGLSELLTLITDVQPYEVNVTGKVWEEGGQEG